MVRSRAQRWGFSHPIELQKNWDVLLESFLRVMELKWTWRRGPFISLQFSSGKQFVNLWSFGFDFQFYFLALCLKYIHIVRYSGDFGQERNILNWIMNYLDANKAGLLTHLLGDGGHVNVSYMSYDWSINSSIVVNWIDSAPLAAEFIRYMLCISQVLICLRV